MTDAVLFVVTGQPVPLGSGLCHFCLFSAIPMLFEFDTEMMAEFANFTRFMSCDLPVVPLLNFLSTIGANSLEGTCLVGTQDGPWEGRFKIEAQNLGSLEPGYMLYPPYDEVELFSFEVCGKPGRAITPDNNSSCVSLVFSEPVLLESTLNGIVQLDANDCLIDVVYDRVNPASLEIFKFHS